jgi:hypothetical protein
MDIVLIVAGVGVGIVILGGGLLLLKGKKGTAPARGVKEEEEYEIIEEEAPFPSFAVEEETEKGCPEEVKKQLLEIQQRLFKDAHKVYLVINNFLKNKHVPPALKKELDIFIRSYNRLREMEEEINVYPFADCEQVFKLKFDFYSKLIRETAQKIMVLARKV